jgi:hypothetical protein
MPDFDIDVAFGAQGELFVANIIDSLSKRGSVEVKMDARYADTGNVYVEYKCKRADGWNWSGIATTQAAFWAFVLGMDTFCFVVETETLKDAVRERWGNPNSHVECTKGSHPTKGVILPVNWLADYSAKCAL